MILVVDSDTGRSNSNTCDYRPKYAYSIMIDITIEKYSYDQCPFSPRLVFTT